MYVIMCHMSQLQSYYKEVYVHRQMEKYLQREDVQPVEPCI